MNLDEYMIEGAPGAWVATNGSSGWRAVTRRLRAAYEQVAKVTGRPFGDVVKWVEVTVHPIPPTWMDEPGPFVAPTEAIERVNELLGDAASVYVSAWGGADLDGHRREHFTGNQLRSLALAFHRLADAIEQ